MILFALCLHPFLRTLEEKLPGIRLSRNTRSPPVVAYADDVTVFVTQPGDFAIIQDAVKCYEKATGAKLNSRKSQALPIGGWSQPATALGIDFHDHVTILGITYGTTIIKSIKDSWAGVVQSVRAQARKAYARTLCLAQRIQYVHLCLLAKIWYLAQILPPTKAHVQQLTTVCTWFIWQGAIFRVPVSILQLPKEQGGWALANIDAKCKTLLYARLWCFSTKDNSITTTLMRKWNLTGPTANPPPPNAHGLPIGIPYIRQYALDMDYVPPPDPQETIQKFKTRLYGASLQTANTSNSTSELRIARKYPGIAWQRVWTNLHTTGLSDSIKSTWYAAIHDIIPTNDRLAAIHLTNTTSCARCGQLIHYC